MRFPKLFAASLLLTLHPLDCAASDELDKALHQIFETNELAIGSFGPARWIEQGNAYTTVEPAFAPAGAREIVRYETATGKRSVLISAAALTPPGAKEPLKLDDYHWSGDARQLLVFTNTKKVWRNNTRGDYWVLNLATGALKKLGGTADPATLMFAHLSPDGTRVAYVRANNIYVEDIRSGAIRALTSNGSPTLINGTSDWVYEEELALRDCIRWSPDGHRVAYWQFDTTGVQQFTLIDNTSELYPKTTLIPYPKSGTSNSSVRVGVVSATGVDECAGGPPTKLPVPHGLG